VNIVESFFDGLRDRVKNPILPAFVISWCVWNWQRILILGFSESSIETRVLEFTRPEWNWQLGFYLVFPLISAAIYVLGMPWVIQAVQWAQMKPIEGARDAKAKFEVRMAKEERKIQEERAKEADLRVAADLVKRVAELERLIRTQTTETESANLLDERLKGIRVVVPDGISGGTSSSKRFSVRVRCQVINDSPHVLNLEKVRVFFGHNVGDGFTSEVSEKDVKTKIAANGAVGECQVTSKEFSTAIDRDSFHVAHIELKFAQIPNLVMAMPDGDDFKISYNPGPTSYS
jgi:hypothetical protein